MQLKITEIAELVNGEVEGDNSIEITGIDKIEDAGLGEL